MVKLLDTAALTENIPARGLLRGQVGTVAENVFEVEFSDDKGRSYAMPCCHFAPTSLWCSTTNP
jgi:hypothetical protein